MARTWASEPELGDDAVRQATGRGWDDWADLLDAWPGDKDDHGVLAAHLVDEHGLEGWWAQTVAVGYERISGRRLPYQRADGTFVASRSKTVDVDVEELRSRLLAADGRAALFPGIETALRSRPTSKNVRLAMGGGTVEIALQPRDDGRALVAVEHGRLDSPEEAERWRTYWADWLQLIAAD
jgi:hypothetical protein